MGASFSPARWALSIVLDDIRCTIPRLHEAVFVEAQRGPLAKAPLYFLKRAISPRLPDQDAKTYGHSAFCMEVIAKMVRTFLTTEKLLLSIAESRSNQKLGFAGARRSAETTLHLDTLTLLAFKKKSILMESYSRNRQLVLDVIRKIYLRQLVSQWGANLRPGFRSRLETRSCQRAHGVDWRSGQSFAAHHR